MTTISETYINTQVTKVTTEVMELSCTCNSDPSDLCYACFKENEPLTPYNSEEDLDEDLDDEINDSFS